MARIFGLPGAPHLGLWEASRTSTILLEFETLSLIVFAEICLRKNE